MPLFQFRVTEESSEKLQQVSLWLRSSSTVIMIAQEVGSETEKQHIHAILDVAVKSTFVQQFHRHFTHTDASGNKVKTYCGNEKYSCEALKKPLVSVIPWHYYNAYNTPPYSQGLQGRPRF